MTPRAVAELVVRMAGEQPTWGYTRIRGVLANLGHHIARITVKRILHDLWVASAPERTQRTPWKTFLQAHGDGLAAADLGTVEVFTLAGLRRSVVFFVIELQTHRVHIAGIHLQPNGRGMEQRARKLTDPVDGFLRTARQLMQDRDPLYTRVVGEILTRGDGGPIRLPPKSPNLNASAERFVRSINEECLPRIVPLGEGHVRLIVHEYVEHDHCERHHQGLDTQLLQRPPPPVRADADVQRRERLGGLLSVYDREAASVVGPLLAPYASAHGDVSSGDKDIDRCFQFLRIHQPHVHASGSGDGQSHTAPLNRSKRQASRSRSGRSLARFGRWMVPPFNRVRALSMGPSCCPSSRSDTCNR